jgi:hypothetical protein
VAADQVAEAEHLLLADDRLEPAGVHLGDQLLGPHTGNDEGHFEDVGFLRFHEQALAAVGESTEGFTAQRCGVVVESLRPEACRLVAERTERERLWGWKEPRTALFLDFWREMLPDARYLFVFRSPWEVADSLYRRGDVAFVKDPVLAVHVWLNYNQRIVDFIRGNPAACLLVEVTQVIADPVRVFAQVRSRLGLPVAEPQSRFREELFIRGDQGRRVAMVRKLLPEAYELYTHLRHIADSPSALPDAQPFQRVVEQGDAAVQEWARASRAESELRRLASELDAVRSRESELRILVSELDAVRSRESELRILVSELDAVRRREAARRQSPVRRLSQFASQVGRRLRRGPHEAVETSPPTLRIDGGGNRDLPSDQAAVRKVA